MHQKLWEQTPEICVIICPPGGSDAHKALITTAIKYEGFRRLLESHLLLKLCHLHSGLKLQETGWCCFLILFSILLSIKTPIWIPHLLNFSVLSWDSSSPCRYFNGQHSRTLSEGVWTHKLRHPLPQVFFFLRQILYSLLNSSKWNSSFSKSLKLRWAAQTWLGSWKLNKVALGKITMNQLFFHLKRKKKGRKNE